MRTLTDFAIKQEYKRVRELGDQLVEVGNRINWEADSYEDDCKPDCHDYAVKNAST